MSRRVCGHLVRTRDRSGGCSKRDDLPRRKPQIAGVKSLHSISIGGSHGVSDASSVAKKNRRETLSSRPKESKHTFTFPPIRKFLMRQKNPPASRPGDFLKRVKSEISRRYEYSRLGRCRPAQENAR